MLDKILSLDTQLFIYLNGLGSETYDGLWLIITKQTSWIPFFILLLYLIFKKLGTKQTLYLLLFVAILVTCSDQITNLFKYGFQRLRPCSDPAINTKIRIIQSSATFSFFSGHAANTMAVATFLYLTLKRYFKYLRLLFLWPLIFAYSRIYLGLHYPSDIICGYLCGLTLGFLMFKLYPIVQKRYFSV
ncbi:phosphatase PAP2 family protein [Flavobacterium sp.]|uniref:phosphatase PAP2 family protein n=1 Tax=Flavobacterium sp. TaxID=239 RepID=UPI0037990839